jgi:hypothetical protein
MENKHGLYGAEIHFTPLCDREVEKHDIIDNDILKKRLYCREKGVFVIITDDPMNNYLTDEDLKLKFEIKDGTANGK